MRGTPTEYRPQTPNQYGPYAFGKISDDLGQVAEAMFASGKDAPLPTGSLLNMTCVWAVKYDANTQKLKALFNHYAIQGQAAPPQAPANEPYHVPVQQPQSPPRPAQAPQQPDNSERTSIERQTTWKDTCQLACHRNDLIPDRAAFFDMLFHGHKWIATGTVDPTAISSPMPTGPANFDPNQDDSDLPLELRADYQG
jgi:hypothetical protein